MFVIPVLAGSVLKFRRSPLLSVLLMGLFAPGVVVGQQEEPELVQAELPFPPPLATLRSALAELAAYEAMEGFSRWNGDDDPALAFLKWGGTTSLPHDLSRLEQLLEGDEHKWRSVERAVTGELLNLVGAELSESADTQIYARDGDRTLRKAVTLLAARLTYLASRGPRTDEESRRAWEGLAASVETMRPGCAVEQLIHGLFVIQSINAGRMLAKHGGRTARARLRASLPLLAPLESAVAGEDRFIRRQATLARYEADKDHLTSWFRADRVGEREILESHRAPFDEAATRLLLDELHQSIHSIISQPFPWQEIPQPAAVLQLWSLWPESSGEGGVAPSEAELALIRDRVHALTNPAGVLMVEACISMYQIVLDRYKEMVLRERLFLVELALLDHREEHGRLPPTLEPLALSTEFITDPLTGKPIAYDPARARLSTADPERAGNFGITVGEVRLEPYEP
ncbi:MAG: hypothetical protein AB7O52_10935 [Planctomycetota bacterium]